MADGTETATLRERRQALYAGGGAARIEKQHAQGKLTARERLGLLFEADSFQESHLFMRHRATHFGLDKQAMPAEGVVTGVGQVDGRPVWVASQDFTVAGGSVGEGTAHKIVSAMDNALKTGSPFVFVNDGGGARIQEGVDALAGYGRIFHRNVALSGVVPQISVIAGPCAGGAAYAPALTDFIIQVRGPGQMFITGPRVIQQVTGEQVTAEALGGADAHATRSGVVHFVAEDDRHAMLLCRKLLSFLPDNNTQDPPVRPDLRPETIGPVPELGRVVSRNPNQPYDMHHVIERVVDGADFLEVRAAFAPNLIVGFGRVAGATVGVVANNPSVKAGVLDIDASDKAAAFVRFCNAFNIPIVTLVDVPGFLPGVGQEHGGIIRHGAKMLFAYGAATVPMVTIIVRKAYGGAYLAMGAKELGVDMVAAWPRAEIAVMGGQGAVNILYRKQIAAAEDPAAAREQYLAEYSEAFANPYVAAGRGLIDDVIDPSDTRAYVAQSLDVLRAKRALRPQKKHGLIPL
ncbi:MAG: acyl-CoA carboxylase subunit beta [Myxococcales bacterium]|nr:acyl-CoA carboxylase subunit beta [Myxococcales bacterium]